jgi:hypothetical protein
MPPCKGIITRRSIMRESIKDKVAIVGMGCTQFGERWDADVEDLIKEASLRGGCIKKKTTLGGGKGGGVRN